MLMHAKHKMRILHFVCSMSQRCLKKIFDVWSMIDRAWKNEKWLAALGKIAFSCKSIENLWELEIGAWSREVA